MKIIFYSSKAYDKDTFVSSATHQYRFIDLPLNEETAMLVNGEQAVCVFVNDILSRQVLKNLSAAGVRLIALRCAGYDNVDLKSAKEFNLKVVRVPAYSPNAVAEHAIALMLSLNRKIIMADRRVRHSNFSLDGLLGFDFSGKTVGIIGTGKIGSIVARIMSAMGSRVLAFDQIVNEDCKQAGVEYKGLDELLAASDVISLHCPLTEKTHHLINQQAIEKMKPGVMLINTSRGGVVDTCAAVDGLETEKIGYLGLDVYENESALFFEDLSCIGTHDNVFDTLLKFPNVLITAHQAFFTADALKNIVMTTEQSLSQFESGMDLLNEVTG